MAWIALRLPDPPVDPPPAPGPEGADAPLRQGALLAGFRHHPAGTPVNLLRYAARDPWPAAQILRLDPDGALRFLTRQGDLAGDTRLPLDGLTPGEEVLVTCSWDSAADRGWLAATMPALNRTAVVPIRTLAPPTWRDALRLAAPAPITRASADLAWAAVGDLPLPAGPLPGLGPQTPVLTPAGPRPVQSLAEGDPVRTAQGEEARVTWTGSAEVPACGDLAPVLLRAPYYGLTEDILIGARQRIRLRGSEVEYLFGAEEVAVEARDLVDGRSAMIAPGVRSLRFHQIMIDRPGTLLSAGLIMEPYAPGLLDTAPAPGCRLFGIGGAAVPPRSCPALRAFEAQTLRRMRAA